VLLVGGQWFAGAQGPADPLRVALAKRVDEAKEGTGAIVGLLTRRGRLFISYGRARADGPEITAETIFEIGSITKVFTALLLADMVERGEVALDDPVRKYLPSGVTVPSRGRRDITLADLATHTSGLPRDPTNLDLRSLADPYAEYRAADLHAFLAGYSLQRDPGTQFEYSNVGMGLLGHALAMRAGLSYEALLTRRVLGPLGMRNTSVVVDEERRSRRATGHSQALAPVPWWHFDADGGSRGHQLDGPGHAGICGGCDGRGYAAESGVRSHDVRPASGRRHRSSARLGRISVSRPRSAREKWCHERIPKPALRRSDRPPRRDRVD